MNEREKLQCRELARLLLGESGGGSDVENLIERSSALPNFRIALMLKFEGSNASIKRIVAKWRESVYSSEPSDDGSDLRHAVEVMTLKQTEIESTLRQSTSEMLDKLKTIDSFTTIQAAMRDELAVMGDLIGRFSNQFASADTTEQPQHQDVNELMHTNELLVLKQQEIRQTLRESTASLLDNLKAIDILATRQVDLQKELSGVSEFLFRMQQQASQMQNGCSDVQGSHP